MYYRKFFANISEIKKYIEPKIYHLFKFRVDQPKPLKIIRLLHTNYFIKMC